MTFRTRGKLTLTALAAGVSLFAVTAMPLFAQSPDDHGPHEQMHQMMDGMMGQGFSERMHQAMPGSEEMMDQCASGMSGMGTMMGRGDTMGRGGMHQ